MLKKKQAKARHCLDVIRRMEREAPNEKVYAYLKTILSSWLDQGYDDDEVMEALDDDAIMASLMIEKLKTTGKNMVDDLSSEDVEDVWSRFQAWKAARVGSDARN